jgi:hypothetical protein
MLEKVFPLYHHQPWAVVVVDLDAPVEFVQLEYSTLHSSTE